MEVTKRAKKLDKPRTLVQSRLRDKSLATVKKAIKKYECSQSEAIDILLFDIKTV